MSLASGARRRRWPLLVAAVGIVVVVAFVVWLVTHQGNDARTASGTATPSVTAASTVLTSEGKLGTSTDWTSVSAAACAVTDLGEAARAVRASAPRTSEGAVRVATAYLEWLLAYPARVDYVDVVADLVYLNSGLPYTKNLLSELKAGYEQTATTGVVTRLVLPGSIQVHLEAADADSDPTTVQVAVKLTSRATKADGSTQDANVTQAVYVGWMEDGWRISSLTRQSTPPAGPFTSAASLCG